MKRKYRIQNRRIVASLFWLLASGFWLLADTASAEEIPQKEIVKTPKVHIVREKDTLWDISKKYLNNPFKWEEVWDKNKSIANPHRIYPGDNIVIPDAFDEKEVEKEASETAEPQTP